MNATKIYLLLVHVSIACFATSCASIINSGTPSIEIITNPPGANIEIDDGAYKCVSPCKLELKTRPTLPLTASLDGFYNSEGEIRREFAISFWVNAIFGVYGLIGMGVDYYTEKAWVWRDEEFSLVPIIAPPKVEETVQETSDNKEKPEPMSPVPPAKPFNSGLPTEVKSPDRPKPTVGSFQEKYPEVEVERRIEWLFGPQTEILLRQHVKCVYEYLEHDLGGEPLPLDAVIRATQGRNEKECIN